MIEFGDDWCKIVARIEVVHKQIITQALMITITFWADVIQVKKREQSLKDSVLFHPFNVIKAMAQTLHVPVRTVGYTEKKVERDGFHEEHAF